MTSGRFALWGIISILVLLLWPDMGGPSAPTSAPADYSPNASGLVQPSGLAVRASALAGLAGFQQLFVESASNSQAQKFVIADCPAGKFALTGGAEIRGPNGQIAPPAIVLYMNMPGPGSPPVSWYAGAQENDTYLLAWSLTTYVVCADAP